MADRFYGLERGETEFQLSEDSSTTSHDIEVRVDLGASLTKNEVLLAIEMIKNHIVKGNWPPA